MLSWLDIISKVVLHNLRKCSHSHLIKDVYDAYNYINSPYENFGG